MDKTIVINLVGHAEPYRLDETAYERLAHYLERAGIRLRDDPDRVEILQDLERSIGDRLAALPGSADRLIVAAEIDRVLDQVGAVDTGRETPVDDDAPIRRRPLRRIREGQWIAGVCNGLADYAELDVGWVRTLFLFGVPFTAGIIILVYVALVFILPVAPRREAVR